jgi:preprotein translocase subunit SecA
MSILNSVLKVFVGDKSKQDVKAILPVVNKIKQFESSVAGLSNDELRAKTTAFKAKIKAFRVHYRGVKNVKFFLYRLTKIYT